MDNKPYWVTVEILAPDLGSAVTFAHEQYGFHNVMSVVQKHRMTNVGTEWYKRSGISKKRSKNKVKS